MPKKDVVRWIDQRFNEFEDKFIKNTKDDTDTATYTRQVLWYIPSTAAVGNDVSGEIIWRGNPGKLIRIDATCLTAPVGSALQHTVQVDGTNAGTVSIAANANTGTTSALSVSQVDDGDSITVDCGAVGSSTAGADVIVILECEVEVET